NRSSTTFSPYVALSELLALTFNLPAIKMSKTRSQKIANDAFVNQINPMLDVCSLMFGLESLKLDIVNNATKLYQLESERTTIEGTMISLENDTGYITSLVGGSKYDQSNQLIRAVQSYLQPGSTFKPLYYSAAIDSKKFNPATIISDTPEVFEKADGTPYIPQNFKGEWEGNVQLWYALAHSMNVPSLKVLREVGFPAAIERTTSLLGIPAEEHNSRRFIPVYPLGLGVCSVRPIEIARAFSIFASSGKEITPMAVRTVEDKNGNVILNPERDIRKKQQEKGNTTQVISPQTAYIMARMLENTPRVGTLQGQGEKLTYKNENGRMYRIPLAGKTGTTQNWADAWMVAFSPYYTSVFWFGFDKPGNSLGLNITGATLAGPAMGDFMGRIHEGFPSRDFVAPSDGVIKVTVCSETGKIPTPECGNHITTQYFLTGTQPTEHCTMHSNTGATAIFYDRLEKELYKSGLHFIQTFEDSPLSIDNDILNPDPLPSETFEEPEFNYFME
ncbi:MAG: penicillin-binding protein, partial [Treponema sp.]|nr:penicillin-binding protein [Treponema sp.]